MVISAKSVPLLFLSIIQRPGIGARSPFLTVFDGKDLTERLKDG
jgi:hypothetical protein